VESSFIADSPRPPLRSSPASGCDHERLGGLPWLKRCERPDLGLLSIVPMISVYIDRSEPVPLHDQVAAEIRRAIAEGEAGPGERLPLVKDIAAVLGVNKNTVIRAMHILRDEGLVEFGRGRGVTVAGTPERSAVLRGVRDLLTFARQHGYRREDVIRLIEQLP